eukprot:scaffold20447_cov200-Amphora_coffeaeformis.AAC.4
MPVNEETGEVATKAKTFECVHEHVRSNPSKVVNIHKLIQGLYGSSVQIEQEARDHGIELEQEFMYNPSALKELVMLRAAAKGIDPRFPRTALEDSLMYTEGEDASMNLVIACPELA